MWDPVSILEAETPVNGETQKNMAPGGSFLEQFPITKKNALIQMNVS